jgi:hypothetical protein
MNRRHFLREGIAGGTVVLGAGGFLLFCRSQARAAVVSRLLDDAVPVLAGQSLTEQQSLPARAREEMRRYFHGKCLNVEGFVSHICSAGFGERLGRCRTEQERQNCFTLAFCSRVATEAEILNRVETVATDVGGELDAAWASYCDTLAGKWNTLLGSSSGPLVGDDLTSRLGGLIRVEMTAAAQLAAADGRAPAVGATIGEIGRSAVLLLPLAGLGPEGVAIGVPVFVLLAIKAVWDFVAGQLEDRRGDYQAAISARLAGLGNRVGSEFEQEVRLRLTDLHTWRERAVRATADRLAAERVGFLEGVS